MSAEADRDRYKATLIALSHLAHPGIAPEVLRAKMLGAIEKALWPEGRP
jgi:hypothetical protein